MKDMNLRVFERLYGTAETFSDLPWHDPEPPTLLVDALDHRAPPGRALDVGCGAGTYSLYMADRGYDVTAIDFMPQAIDMVRRRAAEADQQIDVVHADVRTWTPDASFDVILDVGCLHSLPLSERGAYRRQLCRWLAPGGDFILIHCGSRGWWDRWPIGPHRIGRQAVVDLFSPELTLHEYRDERLRLPLLIGCSALVSRYWFTRERVSTNT
jgi:SAM-dependent methyltransferase